MEDRYLFKAKRTDNEEWVTGSLITCEDGTCKIATRYLDDSANIAILICVYDVDGDTICQCTGLKDKNGNLIWENDIMVAHLDEDYPENETYIRILWRGSGLCSIENRSKDIAPIDKFDTEHFEVCGNIFDSPELLIRNMSDEEQSELITGSLNFDCADYCDIFTQGCAFNCGKKEK